MRIKTPPRKVFIKENGQYIAITNNQHENRKARDVEYRKRYFIPIQSYLIETTFEEYKEFYKEYERRKYHWKQWMQVQVLSLEGFFNEESENDNDNVDFIKNNLVLDVVEDFEERELVEKLHEIIDNLPESEKELIISLFFKGMSEREYSKITGLSQQRIHYQKKKIIKKIKKIFEKW